MTVNQIEVVYDYLMTSSSIKKGLLPSLLLALWFHDSGRQRGQIWTAATPLGETLHVPERHVTSLLSTLST